jgi:hypothetical protein
MVILHPHTRRRHTRMLNTRRRKSIMRRIPLRNRLCNTTVLHAAYRQTLDTMPGQQRLEMRPTRLEGLTTTTARQNAGSRTSRLEQPPTQQKPGRAKNLLFSHPSLAVRLPESLSTTEIDSPSTLAARNQTV